MKRQSVSLKAPPYCRFVRPHRQSFAITSSACRPSVSFSPALRSSLPSSRQPSVTVPTIFAHSGVKVPSAVYDAQQLALSPSDSLQPERPSVAFTTDLLAPISETPISEDAESQLIEKSPSLMSQLPLVVIIQYGVMALHNTTHDQIFLSYLVS